MCRARLLVFMIDVVRGSIHLRGKPRHDNVERFVHQDTGHGIDAFEKRAQDVKRIWRCDGFEGLYYGPDSLCNKR
jgi:hypothetical protein